MILPEKAGQSLCFFVYFLLIKFSRILIANTYSYSKQRKYQNLRINFQNFKNVAFDRSIGVVFSAMFPSRQLTLVVAVFLTGVCSSGCFSNKNKEVVDAPAPPPSAYPTGTAAYSNPAASASAINPVAGGSTEYPPAGAPQTPATPAPFQLREGEQLISHQITSGESLSSIAAKYNSSISRIQSANGMTDSKIFAGKTLQVPTSAMVPDLAMNQAGGANPSYQGQPTQSMPAPMVPPSQQTPVNPSSTSYSRQGGIPAPTPPAGSFPTPSFQGSQIQFSN